ncbi:MAG: DUF3592 domain-containing protein [Betaproteobacteria bacterium]|nr:DUF3592 domain-containing protein [Betaproteobacteria bacterium]PWB60089.1 MAG: hypothetical protein C3F16_11060 [Betaproteobacteria bacterium]
MNPFLHMGMRLGPAGRRWVAILGWLIVALPCLGMAALSAFLWVDEAGNGFAGVPIAGVIESVRDTVKVDGKAIRTDSETTYRYVVDGTTYRGKSTADSYSYDINRAPRPPESFTTTSEGGAPVTVHYDPAAPWRSSLRSPPRRLVQGNLMLWTLATGSAGILLTALGLLYLREPVEILVASPAGADAFVEASLGMVPEDAAPADGGEGISADVATIRRVEGSARIEFRREAGPAFRLAGLFPPVLLLVVLVWFVALKGLGSGATAGFVAWALLAGVVGYIVLSLGYSRARRALWIRNGVMEVIVTGPLGRRRRRLTRAQVDYIEPRWALSEVSRFGEAAYFDLVAVLGDGKRLPIAEGLPRAEVADAMARIVARELGLAPEQALSLSAARSRRLGVAREVLATARAGWRGPT